MTTPAEKYDVRFGDFLVYDETSPSCLRWKVNIYSGQHGKILNVAAGDVAGNKHDYWRVQLHGRLYTCHSIVWALHTGEFSELLDHVSGDNYDNRISNLRAATSAVNARNRRKHLNNSSGVTGVSYRLTKGVAYWTARWRCDGRSVSKSFSVDAYGYEEAFNLAVYERALAIERLNVSGAGYSERHGK